MLKELCETSGISGREEKVRQMLRQRIAPFCRKILMDSMGNLIALKSEEATPPEITLIAHMDEVGGIITQVTEDGFLKFDTIGTVSPTDLVAKKITVNNKSGVIALKAIHLTSKQERHKPVQLKDLMIDIGAADKNSALHTVWPGDVWAFESDYQEFGEDMIKAKALESRSGCEILCRLAEDPELSNVRLVFVVQREVEGGRGAYTALQGLKSAFTIVLDGIASNDYTTDFQKESVSLGKGPVILQGDTSGVYSPQGIRLLCQTAEQAQIPFQLYTGLSKESDADIFRKFPENGIVMQIGIPCLYSHTPCTVMKKQDIRFTQLLLAQFVKQSTNPKGGTSNDGFTAQPYSCSHFK